MVALAALQTASAIVFAFALAKIITSAFASHGQVASLTSWLLLALAAGSMRAAVIWVQEWLAQTSATRAKTQLRSKLLDAIEKLGAGWLQRQSVAELNLLATSGLDALDAYFSKFLPQLVYTALAIPIFLLVIWVSDPISGLILLCTLPLVPVFMMLIGWVTESVQSRQLDAQTRLARHFLEVVRGITTLRVFGRTDAQLDNIRTVSDQHRKSTMKVLRVSFLSGFALELIASLSVALIAVSIGLRLVNAEIGFAAGLFVLLLAPDAYLPLRQVGAHFHASAEGVAVSKRVLDIVDLANAPELSVASEVRFPTLSAGKLTVITGASGAGKSTLLQSALGLSHLEASNLDWLGKSVDQRRKNVAWMPQRTQLKAGNVLANIVGAEPLDEKLAAQCLEQAGLSEFGLEHQVGEGGSLLSGGQRQKLALARTLYRLDRAGCDWLWLDEPTSAADERQVSNLLGLLKNLRANGKSIAVISHERRLLDIADTVIEVPLG